MYEFFTGCMSLFSDTLSAVGKLDFFQFLYGFLTFEASVIILIIAAKTTRKL